MSKNMFRQIGSFMKTAIINVFNFLDDIFVTVLFIIFEDNMITF